MVSTTYSSSPKSFGYLTTKVYSFFQVPQVPGIWRSGEKINRRKKGNFEISLSIYPLDKGIGERNLKDGYIQINGLR